MNQRCWQMSAFHCLTLMKMALKVMKTCLNTRLQTLGRRWWYSELFFSVLHFFFSFCYIIFFWFRSVSMTNVATCVLLILDSSRRMLNCTSVVQSSPSMMTILVWMVCSEDPAILNELYLSTYGLTCYFCVLKVVFLLKSWDQSTPGGSLALTEERRP